MLQARRWLPGRELVVVADSGFAALEFLAALGRRGVACVTHLRLDAALYDPAPPRLPGTNGRPRTKGKRLANLSDVLANPATVWQRVIVPGWYGGGERVVEISTNTAVWRHGGFSNTLDAVRREFWHEQGFVTSRHASDMRKLRSALRNAITYALCQAA